MASDYWTVAVSAGPSRAIFGIYGGLRGSLLLQPGLVPAHRIRSIGRGGLIFVAISVVYSLAPVSISRITLAASSQD